MYLHDGYEDKHGASSLSLKNNVNKLVRIGA